MAEAASLDTLRQTLEAVHTAGGLVIGSIGRAAIYEHMGLNPFLEYEARQQQPLVTATGKPRDVDVIGVSDRGGRFKGLPHFVDPSPYQVLGRDLEKRQEGVWRFKGFSGPAQDINERCFEPFEAEIMGVPCVTVRPATHMALLTPKPRYKIAYELFRDHLPEDEQAFLFSGAYRPFGDFTVLKPAFDKRRSSEH